MNIFEKLNTVTGSVENLTVFVQENSDEIFNFFINQAQLNLSDFKTDIDAFLSSNYKIIKKLDLSINENQIFIDVLIDTTERLNFSLYFQKLCRIKEKADLPISKRNEATSLYINRLRHLADFSNILNSFLNKLQLAFETEEDSNKRVLAVFFNFYANIIRDFGTFNLGGVNSIIGQIKTQKDNYSFLISDITDDILAIDIIESEKAFLAIHSIIDTHLEREIIHLTYSDAEYFIELETEYANKLNDIESEISQIRQLASSLFNGSDDVFYSLGRGVTILSEEQQLYAYLRSYGNMHFAKCNYAYDNIPADFFDYNIEIVDWGCGQALASMTYLDFIKKENINKNIKKIKLNEPSEIALKRGALHIKTFDSNIDIQTIHKDLNSLQVDDFKSNNDNVKLHLFSNILDIDNYSTKQLADLIKKKFTGLNYVVIISPKITDLKTNRIDSFIKEFETGEFEPIKYENKNAGEWTGNWTMFLRLFKVNIE